MSFASLHLYCHVIDNYGDAGVCWRLARQLAAEHRLAVTLWIDQPRVLARLVPGLTLDRPGPEDGTPGLRVRTWDRDADGPTDPPALPDVLVCAFGCEPPPWLRTRLAGAPARPLWINLEYLSAESWVDGCHGLASIKPADGAREYFYYPGFRPSTGGLPREHGLIEARDRFRASGEAVRWWSAHGLPEGPARRVSLFCYPQAPLRALLQGLARQSSAHVVLLPDGVGNADSEQWLAAQTTSREGRHPPRVQAGQLTVVRLPLLPITDYDHLLWCCDLNVVRGEDSWIRALWAGRPLVWQPYRQADDAHQPKLSAFLDWLQARLGGGSVEGLSAQAALMRAWSDAGDPMPAWDDLAPSLGALGARLEAASRDWAAERDLARGLVEFCRSKL